MTSGVVFRRGPVFHFGTDWSPADACDRMVTMVIAKCRWCWSRVQFHGGRCEVCNEAQSLNGWRYATTGAWTIRPFVFGGTEPPYNGPARDPVEIQSDPLTPARAVLLQHLLVRHEAAR